MNIRDATRKAKETGYPMRRAIWKGKTEMCVTPTESDEGCLVSTNRSTRLFPRWQPRAEDLMADDWEVAGEYNQQSKGENHMENIPRIKQILLEQIELLHKGTKNAADGEMGTEKVIAISALLGEHAKAYLSACHLENSEGEESPAKLVKRILDEGSGRKG